MPSTDPEQRRVRPSDTLLTATEKAHELGVSLETLRQWRKAGIGPVHVQYGRTVRYWPETRDEMAEGRGML